MLFTFFVEKKGSTIIEQIESNNPEVALIYWSECSIAKPKFSLDALSDIKVLTPINDCENVWCFSGIDDEDVFFLVHIVATVSKQPQR